MRFLLKVSGYLVILSLGVAAAGVAALYGAYRYVEPALPDPRTLRDVQMQVPLRIYAMDGALIAEFGAQRRFPVTYAQAPTRMVQALLAAEDDRFFEHPGVDWQGLARAAWQLIITGRKAQGGSTITMQVARNFFLSGEKSYLRKLNEIFLAFKIERVLSKEDILALYLNKIYLGQRAYGVKAAAQIYYGVALADLTLPQIAMIAGLPKAPSKWNPISNPDRARLRRAYVLRRLYELGHIDEAQWRAAQAAPITAKAQIARAELAAPYVAEMARAELIERFGDEAYTGGYSVYLRIESDLQRQATKALRAALLEYDRRHGYRGPISRMPADGDLDDRRRELARIAPVGDLLPALVVALEPQTAALELPDGQTIELDWAGMQWARRPLDDPRLGSPPQQAEEILAVGDQVYLDARDDGGWRLAAAPAVEGALVALAPEDGGIRALVGGFDFYRSKFNRAAQAQRQGGSGFKPFVYAAALAQGMTPATMINDAPVVFADSGMEDTWRPENYSGKFYGPTRLREALYRSRNLVSIRILRRIGIDYTADYLTRLGFDPERLPRNLTLALGSATVTPLEMAARYATLANGGFKVTPWLVQRIDDAYGRAVYQADPAVACRVCAPPLAAQTTSAAVAVDDGAPPAVARDDQGRRLAPRVMDAQNHYLIYTMLQDVVRRGTAARVRELGRRDFAGKTGTTNDQRDAWFSGFNGELAATAWVGFDAMQPLGRRETGGRAALPVWMKFMQAALADKAESVLPEPVGLVRAKIDPRSGRITRADDPKGVFELFRDGALPAEVADQDRPTVDGAPISPPPAPGDALDGSEGEIF